MKHHPSPPVTTTRHHQKQMPRTVVFVLPRRIVQALAHAAGPTARVSVAPRAVPFRATPRISQFQQLMAAVLVRFFHDIENRIGVACGCVGGEDEHQW